MATSYGEGSLELDIKTILDANNANPAKWEWYVYLHTELIDLPVPLVESIEFLRDYSSNTGDYILAIFKIGMGDYIKDILPYRDNLQLTLIKRNNKQQISIRYKFILVNNDNYVAGGYQDKMSREDLNSSQLISIEGQCLDRHIELLRTLGVDGIFKSVTVDEVLRFCISDSIAEVKVGSETIHFDVNIVTPANTRVYDHIEVPTGTRILNLATYLHQINYGVYNGGIGTYFQLYGPTLNNTLFIYPLYSNALFSNTAKRLIIYRASTNRFDIIQNTYFVDGDIVKIIATSNTKSINAGDNALIDKGTAFTQADPNTMVERNAIVKNASVVVSKQATMQGQAFKDPKDGNYNPAFAGVTDNLYNQRSNIFRLAQTTFQIQWNHCDIDLLYPGMPVMYVYSDTNNNVRKMTGIVQSVYSKYVKGTNETAALINIMATEETK
jgi:hypothetical protein